MAMVIGDSDGFKAHPGARVVRQAFRDINVAPFHAQLIVEMHDHS